MKLVTENTALQICTSSTATAIAHISKMVMNYEVQTILQDMYQDCRLVCFIFSSELTKLLVNTRYLNNLSMLQNDKILYYAFNKPIEYRSYQMKFQI